MINDNWYKFRVIYICWTTFHVPISKHIFSFQVKCTSFFLSKSNLNQNYNITTYFIVYSKRMSDHVCQSKIRPQLKTIKTKQIKTYITYSADLTFVVLLIQRCIHLYNWIYTFLFYFILLCLTSIKL